ncbi:MAG TPA: HTH domain-containing protein [Candidatus Acidoferrum sp.]|nr:HTH domain-containing protein [Candidatus Acidoferrum sp.]
MTKSERLMYLISLMRSRRVMAVPEMSGLTGVSQRTIYRDMASLSRMNVPVYYDNGYRLARDTGVPLMGLGDDDIELVCFCLRNNVLNEFPYFARRFRVIEQKLVEKLRKRACSERGRVLVLDKSTELTAATLESRIIERFLRAIFENRRITLVTKSGRPVPDTFIPIAIRISRQGYFLAITVSAGVPPSEIPVADLSDIRLRPEKFDRAAIEHLRRESSGLRKSLTRSG